MAKPPFDPTQSYQVAQAEEPRRKNQKVNKPAFDPSAAFEEVTDGGQKVSGVTQTESGLRGAAQGASLGFADEFVGGVEALWEKAKGNPAEFGKLYKQYRDESRANFAAAQEANPGTYTAGELGASVATAFVPGMAIAKGAKLASVIGKSAVIGAGAGAGYSEGDNLQDVALDSLAGGAAGGVVGGAAGAVAPYAGRAIGKVGDKAKGAAERFAGRALGAERGTIKKFGQDKIQQAGRQALDEGVLSPLGSTDDMITRNKAVARKGGGKMDQVYSEIDEAGASTFNPLDVATSVDEELGGFYRSPINKGETNQLENTLESILMRGEKNIPLREAHALKQELQKVANWKNNLNITEREKMARTAYGIVSNAIDEAADKGAKSIGSDDLVNTLREGKVLFSNAKTSEALLDNRLAREQGNNFFGLTDIIAATGAGGYGAATGDWTTAGGALLAKKGLQKYGSQNAALLLDKVGKGLAKAPSASKSVTQSPVLTDKFSRPVKAEISGAAKRVAESEDTPKKGPGKWASDGYDKVAKNLRLKKSKAELLKDPKAKRLLIAASDLKPGSKAMSKVLSQLNALEESN